MKVSSRRAAVAFACGIVAAGALLAASSPRAETSGSDWWTGEAASRTAALESYLKTHDKEFTSFKDAALASKDGTFDLIGMPVVMFRLLPEIFPDIWGKPEDMMMSAGLGADPWEPKKTLPLGIGYLPAKGMNVPFAGHLTVNYATVACGACHMGPVVGPDGKVTRMVGAPTTTFGLFPGLLTKTVSDPRFTAANFRAALAAKPAGWVYGDPALANQEKFEREFFDTDAGSRFFVEETKLASNGATKRFTDTLGVYTYAIPHAAKLGAYVPGSIDVFSELAASPTDPKKMSPSELKAALPLAPGPADIMATFMQSQHAASQWDGTFPLMAYHEAAASLTFSINHPTAVNQDNVVLSSAFIENLPPPPYPFPVDKAKADAGKVLFEASCAGCHKPNNPLLWPPEAVGTDPYRAEVLNDFTVTGLTGILRKACTAAPCFGPGGAKPADIEIMRMTGAYEAAPLNGIWASAPYLHNGSVPTLAALLTGDRPAKFYRGNTTYDTVNVGFTWDKAVDPEAMLLDTSLVGFGNGGHMGPEFNGDMDWAKEPDKLQDLLEYLKTL